MIDIRVPLQPKQAKLLRLVEESPATWIGYGGARGGAKSHGARAVMLLRRLKHPRTRGLIFRRTFEQLWENHIEPLFAQYPFMRAWYHTGHRELTLPNGSSIVFGYAEHPGDIYAFQGKEYMDIAIDEATHLTEAELAFLKTCNRWPGVSPSQCKMLLTMNPGGVGHAFIKRIFIDRRYAENERPSDYAFLAAYAWDNCQWARAALGADGFTERDYYRWLDDERQTYFLRRTDYGQTLDRLPEGLRIGHLLGRWDQFIGQIFSEFDRRVHCIARPPAAFLQQLKLVGAIDHATTGVTCFLVAGIDPDGNLFVLEEYYERGRLICEHARAMIAVMQRWAALAGKPIPAQSYGGAHAACEAFEYVLIDPSTQARTLQGANALDSVQQEYLRFGIPTVAANNALEAGINRVAEYLHVEPDRVHPLRQQRGSPSLFIVERDCPNFIREMIEWRWEEKPNGERTPVGSDHALDCARYIVNSQPAAPERPVARPQLTSIDAKVARTHAAWGKRFDREHNLGGSQNSWF